MPAFLNFGEWTWFVCWSEYLFKALSEQQEDKNTQALKTSFVWHDQDLIIFWDRRQIVVAQSIYKS